MFLKKSKILRFVLPCIQKEKNLPGQGMAFRYSSGDIPKSGGKCWQNSWGFQIRYAEQFQDRKRAAGKKIRGLGYAVLVDIGNRRCVKVRFEETTKILWIHIEYSSKI